MAKRSTYGLDLHRLTKLLSLGAADAIPHEQFCDNTDIASFLKSTMTTPLSSASSPLESLLSMLDCTDIYSEISDKSLCDILTDKTSDLQLLKILKAFGKQICYTIIYENENAMGSTVYHGAIAAAIIYHGEKISRNSYEKLADAFEMLAAKQWMLLALGDLFSQAIKICRQKGMS